MHKLPLGLLALIGLQGCVYYVERPPRRRPPPPHHHQGGGGWDTPAPGDDDEPNWDPDTLTIQEGRWIFELSAPLAEGDCALDGIDGLTVEGRVKYLGPSTISIETPFASLEGEVFADQVVASGGVIYEDARGEIWINAVLDGPTRLYGFAEGEGAGCFLRAELTGYALTQ